MSKSYKKKFYFVVDCCNPDTPAMQMEQALWFKTKRDAQRHANFMKHSNEENAYKLASIEVELLND